MSGLLRQIYERRELMGMLVSRNLKIRYKNSALGFLWSLLVPLILIAIYAIFARILRFNEGSPNYLQFLIVGIIVWQFVSMSLNDSLNSINGNSNLVKKTAFPRIILPLSTILANLVNFLLTACVLVIYLLITGMKIGSLELLPLVLLTHFALCLGMGLVISAMNVFFRDTEHMIGIVTLAWFFLTPIFYPISYQLTRIPENLQWLIFMNPMTGILSSYRLILMSDPITIWPLPLISFAVSWAVLIGGVAFFQSLQPKFSDEL